MIFDQPYSQVLAGIQTQLTQPHNPLYQFDPVRRAIFGPDGSPMSFVGKLEAIRMVGEQHSHIAGQIRILNIRQMRLRDFTLADAKAEGCRDLNDFTAYWILRHGRFQRDALVLVYNFALVKAA
jgi:hypothetical protein